MVEFLDPKHERVDGTCLANNNNGHTVRSGSKVGQKPKNYKTNNKIYT